MTFLKTIAGKIGAALAATVGLACAAPAGAGTVSNVADASWTTGSQRLSSRSNEVRFDVADTGLRVQTYVPLPGSGVTLDLRPSYCVATGASAGASTGATASIPGNATSGAPITISTPVVASSSIRVGQQLVLKVTAPLANRDPAVADVLELEVLSDAGDRERITASETGPDTGEFAAAIATTASSSANRDCRLTVHDHQVITIRMVGADGATTYPIASLEALADPFGVVFDSLTGTPVDGATVSLIDTRTGTPATVFAYDGVTPYPSTVVTGSTVTDSAGRTYDMADGGYLFPLAPLGTYRLQIVPPAPYTAPSTATSAQLAALPRPGGGAYAISTASFGQPFTLATLDPVRIDVPVDGPGGAITVAKTASRELAQPGDTVIWRVTLTNRDSARPSGAISLTDAAASAMRMQPGSLRVDGVAPATGTLVLADDGRGFTLTLPSLTARQSTVVTYAMTVRPDAATGIAVNRALATAQGTSVEAQARLRVQRDTLASRMTIIGRITDGACADPATARGIPGVRVVLEDGSFAVTDADGRYHFEGVVPGNHVVQALAHTLPRGGRLVDCTRSTRSAGQAHSRFVRGQGGSLIVADFHADVPAVLAPIVPGAPTTDEDSGHDWLAMGDGPSGFIAPAVDANPVSPAVRVAVRHRVGETVRLLVDGQPVDPLSLEGTQKDKGGLFAVSHWRGIHLKGAETALSADILRADGSVSESHARTVHFADTPMQAQFVPGLSRLLADGTTRPVIAIRLTDRHGRPVHAGISGQFTLDSPYRSASAAQAAQAQALTGFGTASATWLVEGNDGVAMVELEPTLISGSFRMELEFADGEVRRSQELEGWIEPGDQPWTVVGIAEASAGAISVADLMEHGPDASSDLGDDARIALYAKGRILGKYLLTLSYDSARQRDDQPLLGVIDPAAYYTVFGDNSQRVFDTQSREKLYVRIESAGFYALYGDFMTGFTATTLGQYQRAATGVKAEARLGNVQAQGFAARIATSHRRDEIQGSGLTGPYRLSSRAMVPGSETVAIEVRDRLRPEVIVDRRELVRFADYTVDLLSGTITLAQPLAGRDAALNPQFLIVDFEVDVMGTPEWNAGARATWTSGNGAVRIGATAITDKGEDARTNLGAADVRIMLGEATELKAEVGLSDGATGTSAAWLAELRHHTGRMDITAYARQVDRDYGVGQQNGAERGRRKVGADARVDLVEGLSVVASGWMEDGLDDASNRKALEARLVHRTDRTDAYAGIAHLTETTADGARGTSTVVEAGVTQRLLDNRLELSGGTSFALQRAEAIDLPTRHRIGARYALTPQVKALASYEVAEGATVDSRSVQAGLEFSPIRGSRVVTTLGQQDISTDAGRSFAAFSLGQTLPVTERLTVDLLVDGNRTLGGGIDLADVANPDHPVTSGGYLGEGATLGEDYMAYSAGAMWRADRWSARARAEWRDGEFADRRAVSGALIRDLGEGRVVGGGITWSRATAAQGASTEVVDAALSLAWRPARSDWAMLGKLEYRSDAVTGAVAGEAGAAGNSSLLVDGDARSSRLVLSTAANWSPRADDHASRRTELGLFGAVRHSFDEVDGYDVAGTSVLGGLDLRIGIGANVELGGRATVRANLTDGTTSFAVGPELGVSPAENTVVTVGYNVTGFRDRDFSASRSTDRGIFATVRVKFDADSFGFLGLGR